MDSAKVREPVQLHRSGLDSQLVSGCQFTLDAPNLATLREGNASCRYASAARISITVPAFARRDTNGRQYFVDGLSLGSPSGSRGSCRSCTGP